MKKLFILSAATLALAGCSATTTTVYRPVGSVVTHPLPSAYPAAYPYARPYRPRVRCYSTWDRTPYGLRERRVCG